MKNEMKKQENLQTLKRLTENFEDIKGRFKWGIDKRTEPPVVDIIYHDMKNWIIEKDKLISQAPMIIHHPDLKVMIEKMDRYMKECYIMIENDKVYVATREKIRIVSEILCDIIEQHFFMPRTLPDDEFKIGLSYLINGLMRRKIPEDEYYGYKFHEKKERTLLELLEMFNTRNTAKEVEVQ